MRKFLEAAVGGIKPIRDADPDTPVSLLQCANLQFPRILPLRLKNVKAPGPDTSVLHSQNGIAGIFNAPCVLIRSEGYRLVVAFPVEAADQDNRQFLGITQGLKHTQAFIHCLLVGKPCWVIQPITFNFFSTFPSK